jgi:hypothetical protein
MDLMCKHFNEKSVHNSIITFLISVTVLHTINNFIQMV